jgi:hypothetical protein
MIGELVPPGWLLRPQSWPYWMPNTLLGRLPPLALPDDGVERSSASDREQSFGPNAAAVNLPSVRAATAPTWVEPAASSPASAGILGSLTRNLPGDSQPPLSGGAGILAPLERASGVGEESAPAWLQSVSQWPPRSEPATWDPWAPPVASAPVSASPSAAEGANDSSLPQDLAGDPTLAEILSDADIQELIPGARYAQMGPRRGGGRPGGPELSPAESIRLLLHGNAHRTLRELDPDNPQLQSLSSPNWVPSQSDIARLDEEIARIRRERGLRELEVHHTLPREFERQFGKAGINPEHYKTYVPRDRHRLLPKGLHTGTDNWNAQWRRLFSQLAIPKQKVILKLLNEMLKRLSR